jgi:hypothetical protein
LPKDLNGLEAEDGSIVNATPKESQMNATYSPIRPMIRSAFAAAAVAITLSLGGLIDALAQHYAVDGQQVAATQHVKLASK